MSVNIGSQQASLTDSTTADMEPSSNGQSTIPVNLGAQQLSSTSKQSPQVDVLPIFQSTIPDNFGSQQFSSSDKHLARGQSSRPISLGAYPLQSVPMEPPHNFQTPISTHLGLQQLSPKTRRPSGVHTSLNVQTSVSINTGSQLLLSTNKRPSQMEASPKFRPTMLISPGSQQMSGNKRQHVETPSKVQTESFESVRSKLRESLANALGMLAKQQNKTQTVEKASPSDTAEKQAVFDAQSDELHSITADSSSHETSAGTLTLSEEHQKSSEIGCNENTSDKTKAWKCDVQGYDNKNILLNDELSFNSYSNITDELLQGHGLCWASDVDGECSEAMQSHNPKRPKLEEEETKDNKDISLPDADNLATQIEAELFRLFGGVNKKYKEKGRSLLFNLKDRSNPELRERVLSGEIAPERLCSMTAEELASKELSEWRLAKAEEFAQMVVLQDTEVDIRRLVKKTHKGEFQVEVEHDDSISVEVGLDAGMHSQIPRKPKEEAQVQSKSDGRGKTSPKPNEIKIYEELQSENGDSGGKNHSGNSDTILHDRNDLIQEFMVDELKETEFLPPVVSLDEFMEDLDKEPPFENLPMDSERDTPSSAEKKSNTLDPEMNPASEFFEPEMIPVPDSLGSRSDTASKSSESQVDNSKDILASKTGPSDNVPENPLDISSYKNTKMNEKYSLADSNLMSGSIHGQPATFIADLASKSDFIWEGVIQLNISALATVIGFFRSGEKTSTRDWPGFLEIKGRVRLDAFEKFLQELPLSRSRAIMITLFSWKEGTPEVGRLHLCEAVNSYIADDRVGFAEPTPGVELYLCPPHPKTTEMLGRHLPAEHTACVHSAVDGLIGVVVWRRPVTLSPKTSAHHNHKKQSSSRKQQQDVNSDFPPVSSMPHLHSNTPPSNLQPPPDDEPIDDVPPGFGPRDDDDLPEFDFVNSNSCNNVLPRSQVRGMGLNHSRGMPPPRQTDQMRELIHKYGQSGNASKPTLEIQPWNDDDDIPEWQPHHDKQPQTQQPLLPNPPPPLRPPPQMHGCSQQTTQHFIANQQFVPQPSPQQQQLLLPHAPPQQLMPYAMQMPMPAPMQPQTGLVPEPQNVYPSWQPAPWLPQASRPANVGLPFNGGGIQPCHFNGQPGEAAQFYRGPAPAQNGMGWRPDFPRN